MTTLSPAIAAGLLLAALPLLPLLGFSAPTATAVLEATGAARTTAYKAKAAVDAVLPDLLPPPGRPPAPVPPVAPDTTDIRAAVITFLMDHPGAASGSSQRRKYSEPFRLFVLDLCEAHCHLALEAIAAATQVPLGTLKDWLRGQRPDIQPDSEPINLATIAEPAVSRIETVLTAWAGWNNKKNAFKSFCEHVQFHLRIPFTRQQIDAILTVHRARTPKRRGRPPDASALRGGFDTFFPGAQSVGDGKQLVVQIGDQRYVLNLELLVDADSGAFTGASIRPTEDAKAVTEAFADSVATTGQQPLALLLDNKPSNHCDEVDEALGDTLRIRSRPGVPTDKPHVEGAFGLFSQEAPPLVVTATTLEQLAAEIARLVVTTWGRAVNNRPRTDRKGKTRTQLFQNANPTPEEIEAARAALQERQRKQRLARETRARRQDPLVRALLDAAFERLGLDDPDEHLRIAIASWPLEAVVNAIAIFEGKKKAGTLPKDADGRYLRGIVKNLVDEIEGWQIAEALLRERLAARDRALDHLDKQRDDLEEDGADPEILLKDFVDNALKATRSIDRTFWLLAATDVITDQEPAEHRSLLRLAARRIHATSSVPHRDRLAATRFLFAKVVPIA